MKNNYKLALLSAPLFSNNMGCNALTYGSLEVLSQVAGKLGVEFEYYLVGNPATGVIPPELGSHKLHLIEQLPDFSLGGLIRSVYRRDLRKTRGIAAQLSSMDIFLDNAWGDSFSDIYGQARFQTIVNHCRYAQKYNKPLVLLPQTIGPFSSQAVRKKAAQILRTAAAVYARDPLSVQCAKELVDGLDVFETIDVACFMPYQKRQFRDKKGLVVGINPSGLLWKGGYTGKNQFGLKDDYKKVIRSMIQELLLIKDISIELIGHDISGPNAGDRNDDYYVCKCLQREFPQCTVGPFFYSPVEAKSYISGLDLLIGSRMHCCIAAYSSGVPVYPLAYSRKFKGLFAEKLDYKYLCDLTEDGLESMMNDLQNVMKQLENIKSRMPFRMEILEKYKNELIECLTLKLGKLL